MFLFKLACLLGCTVRELSLRLDPLELVEWEAFYNIDPFGSEREDWRFGVIASVLCNIHKEKNAPPFKPTDFMLSVAQSEPGEEEQAPEEQFAIAKMLQQALGGLIVMEDEE